MIPLGCGIITVYSVAGGRWEWLQKERPWTMELAAKAGARSSVCSARRMELNFVLGLILADEQRASLGPAAPWVAWCFSTEQAWVNAK